MQNRAQQTFMNLALVASVGGRIDPHKRRRLEQAREYLGLSRGEAEDIIQKVLTQGPRRKLRFEGSPQQKQELFFGLLNVATAGGAIYTEVERLLRQIQQHYGIQDPRIEQAFQSVRRIELDERPNVFQSLFPDGSQGSPAGSPYAAPPGAGEGQPSSGGQAQGSGIVSNSASMAHLLLGRLLLTKGRASDEQLRHCLRLQESYLDQGQRVPLGQILVREGVVQAETLQLILRSQWLAPLSREEARFGKLVVENQLAQPAEVKECIAFQRRQSRRGVSVDPLGVLLLMKGYITWQEREAILRAQARMNRGESDG